MEDQIEYVRIVISSDPSPGIGLKVSFFDVGAERCRLIGLNIHFDADLLQLLLKYGGQQPRCFVGGCSEGE